MKRTWKQRALSICMTICLLIGMLPMTTFATDDVKTQSSEATEPEITYSDDNSVNFEETAPVYQETDGGKELILARAGVVNNALTVKVQVYDNSANYGEDYILKYGDTEITKIEGSTSIYDAFRDGGELVSNLPVDAAQAYVTYDESAQTEDSVSAAEMLAQIHDLGAMVAEFDVTFPAKEARVSLEVEMIDDVLSEYDESFMIVALDQEGQVYEGGQVLCSIIDDEEDPTVHVAFDCEETLIVDEETGMAQITFKRTGNLATGTSTVLLYDGEPMGYVDFSPHQDTQVVLALPGTYSLYSDGDYTVGEATITVSEAAEEKEIPSGADPELDAVPSQYDSIQPVRTLNSNSKFPDWAKNYTSTYEDDKSIIVMGSSSNGLFTYDSSSTDGSTSFKSDSNMYLLDTEGGEKEGYLFNRTTSTYNLTGIESVEGSVYIEALTTGYCDVIFGVWNTGHAKIYTNDNDSLQNLKYTLEDNYQGSRYIYYCNSDLSGSWDCGWEGYHPNGFKMNKRTYKIKIEAPNALEYNGSSFAPTLTSGSTTMQYTMDADRHINLSYTFDSSHPVKLVGFRLKKNNSYSSTVSLSQDYITFDQNFLKNYESSWCYDDSDGYNTFTIQPVFAKIGVNYVLNDSALGTISIDSPSDKNLYQGDKVVFSGTGKDGSELTGVYYQKRVSAGSEVLEYGTVGAIGDTVTIELLGSKYSHYTFQGIFSTTGNQLYVDYKDPEDAHGTLYTQGLVLDKNSYDVSNYYPLMADANDGYITVWESNGRVYYGDLFNYQLDGNADNNTITVDFVAESSVTLSNGKIYGYLSRKNTNLLNGVSSDIILANTQYTITTSHGVHSGTTDENGYFEIENFKGVLGGVYSMAVSYQDRTGYATFTYNGAGQYSLSLPQFAVGGFYPVQVTATVDGAGYNQNYIYLTSAGVVEIMADIYVHSDAYKITDVTFHFLSNLSENYGDEVKTMKATYDSSTNLGDKHEAWRLNLNETTALPKDTHLYVSVTAEMTYTYSDSNGTQTGVTETTIDLVDTGYNLAEPLVEDVTPVQQDIPEVPGLQNTETDTSLLDTPVIGTLDMSVTSKTGGYFIQVGSWKEAGDVYTLVCGHSISPNYGTGTLKDKYEQAKGTRDLLDAASDGDPKGTAALKSKQATQVEIAPVFYLKFTVQTADDGNGGLEHYLTGFEFALGIFAGIRKNVPFTVYGVPCYVCITLTTEAYVQAQVALPEGTLLGTVLPAIGEDDTDLNAFFSAPILKFGVKGGIGYNNWASIFAEGTIDAPFTIEFTPLDAAGTVSFDIGIGVDLIGFTAEVEYNSDLYSYGNDTLLENLKSIQQLQNDTSAISPTAASYRLSSGKRYSSLEEALNHATFTISERPEQSTQLLRTSSVDSSMLASGVFKNTRIQLVQLDSGKIMALFLIDNQAEDGSLNYLSAAYAISSDNGQTWSQVEYVSENIGEATNSFQYDINVFELQDRILVTWSEANLDTVLADVDLENITASQIAKAMNAMNLEGRFFDKESGEPMDEAFVIAENSTVFCGGLEAVQNGDMIYVYYQRNALPTEEDVTVEDLLSNERTIAMASANVNDTDNWTSTAVRAMSQNGKQYRIVEVVPFVHDGILGEIAVLDQNGRLAVTNTETGELEADIEDRQIYLRTYDFEEDGTPVPTALTAITEYSDCSQSPQVLSTDDSLYMMYNKNGEIVYMKDFVARDTDSEEVQNSAYVIANSDGTYTVEQPSETGAATIASDESVYIGTTFAASIADDGNIMVSWIATDKEDDSEIPTDEVYGMMLETIDDRLCAAGSPVALTDEDHPIGALDNICMESSEESKFLLAYSRFNETLRKNSTSADIMTQMSVDEPEVSVTVKAPDYPLVGETMLADVTIYNEGFEALNGAEITISGIGETVNVTVEDKVLPGRSIDVTVEVQVPEDFNETTTMSVNVTGLGNQAKYSASTEKEILYGSYIVPMNSPQITSIPNSTDCLVQIPVRNNGNATGTVTLDLKNQVYASDKDEDVRTYTYESDVPVTASGETTISYVMEDTLMDEEIYSTVQVKTGEAYDQSVDAPMPEPTTLTLEDVTVAANNSGGQNDSDTEKPDVSVDSNTPSSGDNNNIMIYVMMISISAIGIGVFGYYRYKLKKKN